MNGKQILSAELREIQLSLLGKVDEYCRKNNLRYSLGGGTLLGAVRHGGYIPWDDDIDLMMPRPDYDKFLDGFDGQYENIDVIHYRKDPKCSKPFARICDNRTIFVETMQKCGVNIEIWAIDGLPEGDKEISAFFDKFDYEVSKLVRSTDLLGVKQGYISVFIKQIIKKIIDPSRKEAVQRFQNFITSYDFEHSKYAACVMGAYRLKEVMNTDVFKHYIELPFEGTNYMVIEDYDSYLKKHYGNYMELPPIEKQNSKHTFEAYWI